MLLRFQAMVLLLMLAPLPNAQCKPEAAFVLIYPKNVQLNHLFLAVTKATKQLPAVVPMQLRTTPSTTRPLTNYLHPVSKKIDQIKRTKKSSGFQLLMKVLTSPLTFRAKPSSSPNLTVQYPSLLIQHCGKSHRFQSWILPKAFT